MPFIDLDRVELPFSGEEFDHVIVGSGAVGIMMGVELSRKGKKVLMLESGRFGEHQDRQVDNEVVQTGKRLENAVWGRKRAVGGTTIAWGGQSLPFRAVDFCRRDWVSASGWPISFHDLSAYYTPANAFMQIDGLDYHDDIFRMFGLRKPAFDRAVDFHFSKWAPEPDFTKVNARALEQDLPVVFNAMLTRLITHGNGSISEVEISNHAGRKNVLKVNQLLLATGGIESNRILLNSRDLNGSVIGDHSGWLGRGFMDHPCIATGKLRPNHAYAFQQLFNTNIRGGRKYSKRLSLSESFQTEQQLLNASASLMFSYPEEEFDPYQEILSLRNRRMPNLFKVIRHADTYALAARGYLLDHFVYKHRAEATLIMMLEQEPLRSSRISLADQSDRFGLQKASIHWDISHKTWESMITLSDRLGADFTRLGLGTYIPYAHIRMDNDGWMDHLSDVNHHMGGTRMSAVASEGVVDPDLRVWGYNNLYVMSASVFPTSSHSNPTLTLLALCQKWLKEQVRP
jgi:hypothetical protein